MRHLRLFPAVRERCGAGCRCGRSALRRKGRERTAPRRQARQGGRGRKQSPPSRIESSHYSSFPSPPPKPEAGRRAGRTSVRGVSLRTGVAVPCANIRAATAQELRVVDRDCIRASASRIFHAFPGGGKQARGTERGGEAPPAPKARRHGAPDGGGLHGPKGPQRREGEDVIVGHISISLPTETGCVSGAAERRAERDSKRAERKIALHRTDFCVPPQGAEAADRRRRRDRPESRAGALRRSGAAPNGRHRRRGDIGLPGKRPDGEQRLRRNRMRSAFRTQCAEKRKHPKHAERFRRRRARLRTSHAMCRDEKATGKRRTYPAIPNATRISHAMRREAETSETRRRLPEKVGASSDLARDVPGRKGHRETQNVSGDTGRDPHFARKSPRSGNIRNAPNAYGEGGPRNGRSRGAAATGSRTFSALRKKAFRGGGICFFRGKSLYLYDI